jgi:hypothetical protein
MAKLGHNYSIRSSPLEATSHSTVHLIGRVEGQVTLVTISSKEVLEKVGAISKAEYTNTLVDLPDA